MANQKRRKKRSRSFIALVFYAVITAIFLKSFIIAAYKIPSGSMEDTLLEGDFILVNKLSFGSETPSTIPFTDIEIPVIKIPGFSDPDCGDIVVFKFPCTRKCEYYIKRCIGKPGDYIEIKNKNVFINDNRLILPVDLKFDANENYLKGMEQEKIFPINKSWNEDFYGPLYIPQKGDTLKISSQIDIYRTIIEFENRADSVIINNGKLSLNGNILDNYVVKNDYYFVLGDNRNDSMDSRFWGFVPRENIVGSALLVYWSINNENNSSGFFSSVRWNRILTIIR